MTFKVIQNINLALGPYGRPRCQGSRSCNRPAHYSQIGVAKEKTGNTVSGRRVVCLDHSTAKSWRV